MSIPFNMLYSKRFVSPIQYRIVLYNSVKFRLYFNTILALRYAVYVAMTPISLREIIQSDPTIHTSNFQVSPRKLFSFNTCQPNMFAFFFSLKTFVSLLAQTVAEKRWTIFLLIPETSVSWKD